VDLVEQNGRCSQRSNTAERDNRCRIDHRRARLGEDPLGRHVRQTESIQFTSDETNDLGPAVAVELDTRLGMDRAHGEDDRVTRPVADVAVPKPVRRRLGRQ
jgi:hypothetical protein